MLRSLAVALLLAVPLGAQAPSAPPAAKQAATDAVNARLSLARLRRLRCVSHDFANCPGGLEIVQDVVILPGTMHGDTAEFTVTWHPVGDVASSEASFMFVPNRDETSVDSGTVNVIRRGTRWMLDTRRPMSEHQLTSVAAARRFFQFEAEDIPKLDSAVARHASRPRVPMEQ